jgi:hypothetical protein
VERNNQSLKLRFHVATNRDYTNNSPQLRLAPASPHRQAEVKNRPMPQLTRNSEAAAVGFHYGLADRQSHARPVDLHALVPSAIEFFEDEGLLEIVDAGTAIGNTDDECLVLGFRGYGSGSCRPDSGEL